MTNASRRPILIGMALLVLAALACRRSLTVTPVSAPPSPSPAPTMTPTPQPTLAPPAVPDLVALQAQLERVYRQSNPGVVAIRTLDNSGLGSGFVVDLAGHIVTNMHVVGEETVLEVDFPSGDKVRGQVIGRDPDLDIAVLQVDVPETWLHPLPLGDSATLEVGAVVVAIGNPFGLSGTMTLGIVSAKGRTMASEHLAPDAGVFSTGDIIQTDAPINPGNSGGPLLNLQGEVVGVNRAIRTERYTTNGEPLNSGIGFAVPINLVKRVLPALIASGRYDHPYLGIASLDDLSLLQLEALGLPPHGGVYITQVVPGGPADQAGLRAGDRRSDLPGVPAGGDLIIRIDDREVRSFGDLMSYLLNYTRPGDTVVLTVWRDGQEVEVPVTLGKRP